jgi:uncharacterized coiled-coil DUF342 family protein
MSSGDEEIRSEIEELREKLLRARREQRTHDDELKRLAVELDEVVQRLRQARTNGGKRKNES